MLDQDAMLKSMLTAKQGFMQAPGGGSQNRPMPAGGSGALGQMAGRMDQGYSRKRRRPPSGMRETKPTDTGGGPGRNVGFDSLRPQPANASFYGLQQRLNGLYGGPQRQLHGYY